MAAIDDHCIDPSKFFHCCFYNLLDISFALQVASNRNSSDALCNLMNFLRSRKQGSGVATTCHFDSTCFSYSLAGGSNQCNGHVSSIPNHDDGASCQCQIS